MFIMTIDSRIQECTSLCLWLGIYSKTRCMNDSFFQSFLKILNNLPHYRNFVISLRPFADLSSICFCLHCHSTNTGKNCQRSNSGHKQSKNTSSVFSWHCQSMKSLSLFTPLVLINRSSGGSPAVKRCSSNVSIVIVSGSGYNEASRESFGGESGCKVVLEEIESSISEILEGVGELARSGE